MQLFHAEALPSAVPQRSIDVRGFINGQSKLGAALWVKTTQRAFLMGQPSVEHMRKGVSFLKIGAIICIRGNVPAGWTVRDSQRFKESTADFSVVKIVTPGISTFMINHLWLKLVSDGITDIVIAMAEFTQKRRLQLKPDSIRFPVVRMN